MFNRKVLKARAKEVLKTSYWQTFGVLLLIQLIGSAASMFFTLPSRVISGTLSTFAAFMLLGVILVLVALYLVINIFFLTPLSLGGNKFLLDAAKSGFTDVGAIGYSFRSNYKNIVKVTFMKSLILVAFGVVPLLLLAAGYGYSASLLGIGLYDASAYSSISFSGSDTLFVLLTVLAYILLIPLYMKVYDYYLVEYILAEDSDMTWREALAKSKKLMRGNRWATFVMNLSFFGWLLLGTCACGIGTLFVLPYIKATDTQLYLELTGQSVIETFYENTENI